MTKELTGKAALVTGSTSGMGKGIAEALAAAGCNVMLNGFGAADEIEALRSELAATHAVEVRHHGADLTRPAEIAELFAKTTEHFGAVDILVNNAGAQFVSPIEEFPDDKWDALLA